MPKRSTKKSPIQEMSENLRNYIDADPKKKAETQIGGVLIGPDDVELVKAALIMRANYIETGTVYMNRNDALAHNKSMPSGKAPYSMLEKHRRPVEIRALDPEQEVLVERTKRLIQYLNHF